MPSALACLAAACAATPPPPPRPAYRIESRVDAESAAQQQPGPTPPQQPEPAAHPEPAPAPPARPAQAGEPAQDDAARLRARFGSHILLKPDGRITKHYFVSGESGDVLRSFLTEPGQAAPPRNETVRVSAAAGSRCVLARMLGAHEIDALFLDRFEEPEGVAIRARVDHTAVEPMRWPANELMLVTALPQALAGFENALNLFLTNVPQVEIEVKVVEYTTTDTLATGVDQLRDAAGNPTAPFLANVDSDTLIREITSNFPMAPPITGVGSSGDRSLIQLGGIHDSWQLAAQLQLLEARGVADVLSNPRMVVRNGGLASVTLTTDIPYPEAKISSSGQNITANIVFKPVGITLNIRPVLAGTDTIILQVFASVSAVTSFAATTPVATPIIASREALTSVHVPSNKTTVIGGLISRSTFENETKFPILGDIPILGYLFRSRVEQTTKSTLEFHITPRLVQGSRSFPSHPGGG